MDSFTWAISHMRSKPTTTNPFADGGTSASAYSRTGQAPMADSIQQQKLTPALEKQIAKNARELAQSETARGLRSGKLKADTPAECTEVSVFERRRSEEIADRARSRFRESGRLPAGIAQDIRQVAAMPSINDLVGRTQAPVIYDD